MRGPQFLSLHPILGTRDIERGIAFYTKELGFALAFRDGGTPTNYAGLKRDGIVLHMQFQYEHEMGTIRLRFRVSDPDALLAEFKGRKVAIQTEIRDTTWGTREFALYDPDRNALTFFRDSSSEQAFR
jgi:catechol 2,3-dioxygenase-like lactoylglutathione lyase family enzyme